MSFDFSKISVYIFNWKKVTENTIKLYEKISLIIPETTIINCDENHIFDSSVKHIQLDDNYYYGGQYDKAIKDVKSGNIFCVIVGDNIVENSFLELFNSAIFAFNNYKIGVYSPNDKRTSHKKRNKLVDRNLYDVDNTDCGFWFIHPSLVEKLRNINYNVSKYGWGIDKNTIAEARKSGLLVLRDYSVETDQINYNTGYNSQDARVGMRMLELEWAKIK
jgi:hypothetical protein